MQRRRLELIRYSIKIEKQYGPISTYVQCLPAVTSWIINLLFESFLRNFLLVLNESDSYCIWRMHVDFYFWLTEVLLYNIHTLLGFYSFWHWFDRVPYSWSILNEFVFYWKIACTIYANQILFSLPKDLRLFKIGNSIKVHMMKVQLTWLRSEEWWLEKETDFASKPLQNPQNGQVRRTGSRIFKWW